MPLKNEIVILVLFLFFTTLVSGQEDVYIDVPPEDIVLENGEKRMDVLEKHIDEMIFKPFSLKGFPGAIQSQRPAKILRNRPFKEEEYRVVTAFDRKEIEAVYYENIESGILSYRAKDDKQYLAVRLQEEWVILSGRGFKLSNIYGHKFRWVDCGGKKLLQSTATRRENVWQKLGAAGGEHWKSGRVLALIDFENRHFVLDFLYLEYDYRSNVKKRDIVVEEAGVSSGEEPIYVEVKRSDQQKATYDAHVYLDKLEVIKKGCESKVVITGRFKDDSAKKPFLHELTKTIRVADPCSTLALEGKYKFKGKHFELID